MRRPMSLLAQEGPKCRVRLAGSITHLGEGDRDAHVVTGWHGGRFLGEYALRLGLASLICHDAGVGCEQAGIAALPLLDRWQVPAASIDYRSARIGEAEDMYRRGIVSFANLAARAVGIVPGLRCEDASRVFAASRPRDTRLIPLRPSTWRPHRHAIVIIAAPFFSEPVEMIALDSASDIVADDAGKVVLTGSHGGLPGGTAAKAIKAKVRLAAFNDAGVGIDDAGIARLQALDGLAIPAFTVAAHSARIGDGRSTCENGIIAR